MKYKFVFQEEKATPFKQDADLQMYYETTNTMESDDAKVVAGALRSLAERLDPPERVYR